MKYYYIPQENILVHGAESGVMGKYREWHYKSKACLSAPQYSKGTKTVRSRTAEIQIDKGANMAGTEGDVVGEEGRVLHRFGEPLAGPDSHIDWG